jgi:glycosyltransferase involved in cell wall biosynthesis
MSSTAQIQVDLMGHAHSTLRIAIVTETYPPDVNGVAHTLSKIVEGLIDRGHLIWLIHPSQSSEALQDTSGRFKQVLVKGLPIPFYKQLRMGFPAKKELLRLWTQHRPDVVHIATEGPLGWSALQAAKKLKLPISSDFRTNFHAYSHHYGIGWLHGAIMSYLRKFHNTTNCTMVPTDRLKDELNALGFKNLKVVPRGVDTQHFNPNQRQISLRERWNAKPETVVMMCVGRLAAEKNLSQVVQTYQAAKSQSKDVRLVLVGDGPMRDALQAENPDIIFSGFQKGQDLAQHYASADVFLFPSMTETFGNVTLEAMASGLTVVAYKHAAAGEIIDSGHNGLIAPEGDATAFTQAALMLLQAPLQRKSMAQQARATAEAMAWQLIFQKTETVLHQVIADCDLSYSKKIQTHALAST